MKNNIENNAIKSLHTGEVECSIHSAPTIGPAYKEKQNQRCRQDARPRAALSPCPPNGSIAQNDTETRRSETWTFRGLCSAPVPAQLKSIPEGFTFIYYVQVSDFIKIGSSRRWKRRVANIQTASPFEATVLMVEINKPAFELSLHKRFAQYRRRGEWFHATPELIAFITKRIETNDISTRPDYQIW